MASNRPGLETACGYPAHPWACNWLRARRNRRVYGVVGRLLLRLIRGQQPIRHVSKAGITYWWMSDGFENLCGAHNESLVLSQLLTTQPSFVGRVSWIRRRSATATSEASAVQDPYENGKDLKLRSCTLRRTRFNSSMAPPRSRRKPSTSSRSFRARKRSTSSGRFPHTYPWITKTSLRS